MSFKGLNDKHRRAALPHFLSASRKISGLLLSVAVDRTLQRHLFYQGEEPSPELMPIVERWKPDPLRKLLTASNLVSLAVAGLSRPDQDLLWITDEDAIAADDQRKREACDLFAIVSSFYLPHTMGDFRFNSASTDDGSKRLEDLLAIPDLAAGFIAETLARLTENQVPLRAGTAANLPDGTSLKTQELTIWFAETATQLRQLAYAITPGDGAETLRFSRLDFQAHRL